MGGEISPDSLVLVEAHEDPPGPPATCFPSPSGKACNLVWPHCYPNSLNFSLVSANVNHFVTDVLSAFAIPNTNTLSNVALRSFHRLKSSIQHCFRWGSKVR